MQSFPVYDTYYPFAQLLTRRCRIVLGEMSEVVQIDGSVVQ